MKFAKNLRVRDKKHLLWLREIMCVKCHWWCTDGNHAAHIRKFTDGGIGIKPSDWFAVSLCPPCHQNQHSVGELRFWKDKLISAIELAKKLYAVSGDRKAAINLIKEADL